MQQRVRNYVGLRDREPARQQQLLLVQKIRAELSEKYTLEALLPNGDEQQQRQYENSKFMAKWQVKEILTRERLRSLFERYAWYQEIRLQEYLEDYCCVIATLVTFDWNKWAQFDSLFMVRQLSNSKLPISEPMLEFMSIADRRAFTQIQHIYCPVVFVEDFNCKYLPDARLPLVQSTKINGGGFAQIHEVVIDKHQMRFTRHHPHESAHRVPMALKLIQNRDSWERECLVQKILKHCSIRHESIVLSFASFERGRDLGILYPLAALNLAEFFQGTHPSYTQHVGQFKLQDLYQQFFNLAGAFRFIHTDLWHKNGAEYTCFHHDIKPDNVLIYWNSTESSVGDWKIIDFGLSTMSPHTGHSDALTLSPDSTLPHSNASSSVDPPRASGPYQGPEMRDGGRVGRPADMWSFGTVFAEGVAWGFGGPSSVASLSLARHTGGDGRFWALNEKNTSMLKPGVDEWFSEIEDTHTAGPKYLLESVKLVRGLLDVDKKSRFKADKTWELMKVIQSLAKDAPFLWNVPKSSPAQETQSQSSQRRLSISTEAGQNRITSPNRVHGIRARFRQSKLGKLLIPKTTVEPGGRVAENVAVSSAIPVVPYWPMSPTTTQFCRVVVPSSTVQAVLGANAQLAAFRSEENIYFYNVRNLAMQDLHWTTWPENSDGTHAPKVSSLDMFPAPDNRTWKSVNMAGNYVACRSVDLHRLEHDIIYLYTFGLPANLNSNLISWSSPEPVKLDSDCLDVQLSPSGHLVMIYREHIELRTRLGKCLRISDFNIKFRAAAFSTDGTTLCIWRTDEENGMDCWYFYTVTDTTYHQYIRRKYTASPLALLQISDSTAKTCQDFLLVPIQDKKCFLACDASGHVNYLDIGAPDRVQQDHDQCTGAYMALPCVEGSIALLRKVDGMELTDVTMALSSLQGSQPHIKFQSGWSTLENQEHGKDCGATTFFHKSRIGLFASYLDGTITRQTA